MRNTTRTRRTVAARPARVDKIQLTGSKPRRPLSTYARNDDYEEEATVPVTVRGIVAEARVDRARKPQVSVRLEEPINRDGLEPGDIYFSINLETKDIRGGEITMFAPPETIIALAKCVGHVIEGARQRGIIPAGEEPLSEFTIDRMRRGLLNIGQSTPTS
jgi:hypothetical protein